MQSVPAYRNLATSNPKKTAKIYNGGARLPRRIEHDVDDATHVLAISPLHRPAKDSPHCRTINNGNRRFCRRRWRFRLGIIRGWHDLRQSYEQNRSQDDANVGSLRAHEALLIRTRKGESRNHCDRQWFHSVATASRALCYQRIEKRIVMIYRFARTKPSLSERGKAKAEITAIGNGFTVSQPPHARFAINGSKNES